MMKIGIILAAVSAVAVAGGAQAEAGYAGLHVEAQGGWDHSTARLNYDDGVFEEHGHDSFDGVTYGVGAGYDVDLGGVLLGTEGAINWSTAKDCSSDGFERDCLKFGREIELGARLGTQLGANGPLLYGKIAYVNARLKAKVSDVEGDVLTGHRNLDGVRFGVGLEQKLARQFYVKAEYRYTRFDDFHLNDTTKAGFDRHQVIGGLGVLF
jgi:outer membrane immunogenic protein